MALIPYRSIWDIDPWSDDDWLGPSFKMAKVNALKMDVYEKDGNVVAKAQLPGFKAEQINAQVNDDMITIEAQSQTDKEEGDDKKGYWRKEISQGYVKRVVPLPVDVDSSKAQAEFENGVLTITVPKMEKLKEEEKQKKLEIKKK